MGYRLLPDGIYATLGISALLAWGLMEHVPRSGLYAWLTTVLLVSGARLLSWRAWNHGEAPESVRWVGLFYLGAVAGGLTWGAAGLLLFPDESGGQLLITFALAGIAAGAMSTLGILPGAYAAFVLTAILPFSARLFMQPGESYALMGAMSLIYLIFLLSAARRIYLAYAESLRLRFENEDMTERQDVLTTAAITDSLTGAYNRNMLNVALPREIERARRYGTPLAIIMLDIDHFKRVNDKHGHQMGDRTLVWVTERIATQLRDSDVLFRWGGEEFMVLAPGIDLAGAGQVAERMRREIERSPFESVGAITCSFGCSEFRPDDTRDGFIQRADSALYRAKTNGRNRVEKV